MGFVDNIIAKCIINFWCERLMKRFIDVFSLAPLDLATVVGFFVVSRPFFSPTHPMATANSSERLEVSSCTVD